MRVSFVVIVSIISSGCVDGVLFGPPVVDRVLISPSPATANDELVCSYEGFQGGDDVSQLEWRINGEVVGDGDVLVDGFVRGDEVSCTVTPDNGKKVGESVTHSVTIDNAPPVLEGVTIGPDSPTSSDSLFCNAGKTTDVDGETSFTYTYGWVVDGQELPETGRELSASWLTRGDSVYCQARVSDGTSQSAFVASESVEIGNSPPRVEGAAIEPSSPLPDDVITCDYTAFVDADGDSDQTRIAWTINAVAAGTGATLTASVERGDVVKCKLTPYDGFEEGEIVWIGATVVADGECDSDGDGYWLSSAAQFECDVLEETNYYRSIGYNCDTEGRFKATTPLEMQAELRMAARYHSRWMADRETLSHDSPGGPYGDTFVDRIEWAGYTGWRLVGENIASGYSSPSAVVEGWMESDGHCANIMNPEFNEIGIGYFYDSGTRYKHWWTQNFGKR